jgi:uncharacterized membrane protein
VNEITDDEKATGRIEAFSDGVFAIAITLLVLELKVPARDEAATGAELLALLGRAWPSYAAYLVSFAMILIMWVNHHRLFTLITRSDGRFLFLNGFLLLVVSTVPFPTSLLAEFLEQPSATVAMAIYAGLHVVLALAFNGLWRYAAYKRRLLGRAVTERQISVVNRAFLIGPMLYLLAFLLAFVNVFASFGLCAALAIFFAITSVE